MVDVFGSTTGLVGVKTAVAAADCDALQKKARKENRGKQAAGYKPFTSSARKEVLALKTSFVESLHEYAKSKSLDPHSIMQYAFRAELLETRPGHAWRDFLHIRGGARGG